MDLKSEAESEELFPIGSSSTQQGRPNRLELWKYFKRGTEKYKQSGQREAFCNACSAHNGYETPVRGDQPAMWTHIVACHYFSPSLREALRIQRTPDGTNYERKKFKREMQAPTPVPKVHLIKSAPHQKPAPENGLVMVSSCSSSLGGLERKMDVKEKSGFFTDIVRGFLSAGVPFGAIDKPQFQQIFRSLRPKVELPTAAELAGTLFSGEVSKMEQDTMSSLKGARFVTLDFQLLDVLSSTVLGILATTRRNGFAESFLLSCEILSAEKQQVNLEMVERVTQNVKFLKDTYDADVRCVIIKNILASASSRKLLEEKLPHVISIHCYKEQVEFVLKHLLDTLDCSALILQAVQVASYFQRNSAMQNRLSALQNTLLQKTVSIEKPTDSDWRSYFVCFSGLAVSKVALQALVEQLNEDVPLEILEIVLADIFWANLKRLLPVLEAVVSAQTQFASETCCIAEILQQFRGIYRSFAGFPVLAARERLLQSLELQWRNCCDRKTLMLSCVLDPRLKLYLFSPSSVSWSQVCSWSVEFFQRLFQRPAETLLPSLTKYRDGNSAPFDESSIKMWRNPVDYWEFVRADHEELGELALFFFSVCPSGTPVEPIWRTASSVAHSALHQNPLKECQVTSAVAAIKMKMMRDARRDAEVKSRDQKRKSISNGLPKGEKMPEPVYSASEKGSVSVNCDMFEFIAGTDAAAEFADIRFLLNKFASLDEGPANGLSELLGSCIEGQEVDRFFTLTELFGSL